MVVLLMSCNEDKDNCHKYITIVNNSSSVIYSQESYSYPDSLSFANTFPNPNLAVNDHVVQAGSLSNRAVSLSGRNCINYYMSSPDICPSEIVMVYIFDADSLAAKPWSNDPNLVLKRYDLTIDDLNAINWTITYA
ncbi:hypothetical protein [Owenweeksia hongkongensis]|uniref:hypothetical protein n=1 Tax=Owenweeksia hongkongensis TaxID=253245 RepID=UPI003A91870C